MNVFRTAWIVARRDFGSIVFTPTFLLFLLAPLFFVGFAMLGGGGARALASNAGASMRMVAIVPAEETAAFQAVDARMRRISAAPTLVVMTNNAEHQRQIPALARDANLVALLVGPAAHPHIRERNKDGMSGQYLATLAEQVAREGSARAASSTAVSQPSFETLATPRGSSHAGQSTLGYSAVFGLFLLTLLLGGQTVGMLAEEKGNKVIEIMAAAAPLQGVFLGKLFAMMAIALVFVGFWAALIGILVLTAGQSSPDALSALSVTPAIGWPLFILFTCIYFLMAFLLLGSVFLGVGAQANTVREIQMLSLPITLFQVGMFALASAAANMPGTSTSIIAQILPWSSPFAMTARAATDASLWPHLVALMWQMLWVVISISIAVRLFRTGVLKSGGSSWVGKLASTLSR